MLNNNLFALLITFVVALAWLRINDFAAHRGWISPHVSRKFIHIGTGPLFVLCWLLFDDSQSSRFLAALVPLTITVQFILVGFSVIKDEAAVQAMSRTGDPREILRGPLFYGLVFVAMTVIYWNTTPTGIIALMLMCGGDGFADLIGRRWGKTTLPWSDHKTWVGSMAMFFWGWFFAATILFIYQMVGQFPLPFSEYLPAITAAALIGTAVEAIPISDIDNLTVTISAVLVGLALLP
jgi:phytol kinase